MDNGNICYITIIANRKAKDSLLKSLAKAGLKIVDSYYGRGVAKANDFRHAFGFVVEQQKIVITGLIKEIQRDSIFEMLDTEFEFSKPNTGIAYSIPLDKLSF